MESVLFARHQVCMEGFWWCCCRGLVNQAAVDGSVQSGRNLQGGERFPQIALGDARDGFDRIVDDVEVLRRGHQRDLVLDFRVRERAESEDGATRLDGFDDLRGIVAREDESAGFCELLHDASQGALGVVGQRVGLVEEDDLERGIAVGRGSSELLDLAADALQFSLV